MSPRARANAVWSVPLAPEGDGHVSAADAAAFERVFRLQATALHAFAYHIVRSRAVADDVVQEAFLAAWHSGKGWDSERGLTSYLFIAVRNHARLHLRHARVVDQHSAREVIGQFEAAAPAADRLHQRDVVQTAVREAIDALPERSRLVLILSRFTDLSYAEIAETLGISVKTVESQLDRAFRHLRARLSSHWPLAVIVFVLLRYLRSPAA